MAALLPTPSALEWLAVILAVVGAVSVGFALVDARPVSVGLEMSFAVLTVALALAGLWVIPHLMAAGFVLHGLWDMLHFWRRPVVPTRLPWWHTVFCLTFDFPVAAYIWWRWL